MQRGEWGRAGLYMEQVGRGGRWRDKARPVQRMWGPQMVRWEQREQGPVGMLT